MGFYKSSVYGRIILSQVFVQLISSSFCENRSSSDFQSSKSFFHGFFRRFAFPPGTFLIVTPELTIPAWRDYPVASRNGRADIGQSYCDGEDDQIAGSKVGLGYVNQVDDFAAIKNSAIDISSPFFVYFDTLGWTHEDSIFNTPPQVASFMQEYLVDPVLNIFGVPPPSSLDLKKRGESNVVNGDKRVKKQHLSLADSHRLSVFRKIERLLEDLGAENGRACLLRIICEIHEFPFDKGRFGIFGEVLALILGVIPEANEIEGQVDTSPCLNIYARAEKQGKKGNCLKYSKHCQFSIFQWFWSFNLPEKNTSKFQI